MRHVGPLNGDTTPLTRDRVKGSHVLLSQARTDTHAVD